MRNVLKYILFVCVKAGSLFVALAVLGLTILIDCFSVFFVPLMKYPGSHFKSIYSP